MARIKKEATAAPDALWALWRDVVAEFGLRRMAWSLMRSKTGWGIYGADMASTLRATPMAEGAITRMSDVPPREMERLAGLAGINARRGEAMWRLAVLMYVTVPVGVFLAGLEGVPEVIKTVVAGQALMFGVFVILLTLWLLVYFANYWRAKQIEAVIDLARLERGFSLGDIGDEGGANV
ncbi:hypothetical protein [Brevundimonas sp.]|uniref:hypothetical protein n=1 Tax=Brevundimonas sp. TaxID=1871086 RepID=UPI003D1463BF